MSKVTKVLAKIHVKTTNKKPEDNMTTDRSSEINHNRAKSSLQCVRPLQL
jgi:hypothetical protein